MKQKIIALLNDGYTITSVPLKEAQSRKHFDLKVKNNSWSWFGGKRHKIGSSVPFCLDEKQAKRAGYTHYDSENPKHAREGVIGVYDQNNILHVNQMVADAINASAIINGHGN